MALIPSIMEVRAMFLKVRDFRRGVRCLLWCEKSIFGLLVVNELDGRIDESTELLLEF